MDFLPNMPGEVPRLVGPAGGFGSTGFFTDFFTASGGGGLGSSVGHVIVPSARPDPAVQSSPEMLKMAVAFLKQQAPVKCSFPQRPVVVPEPLKQDHNADLHLLPSPASPASPYDSPRLMGPVKKPAAVTHHAHARAVKDADAAEIEAEKDVESAMVAEAV